MVRVSGGRFKMGEVIEYADSHLDVTGPVKVSLSRPFLFARTEVTQALWLHVTGESPWLGREVCSVGPDLPAVCVTWLEAISFCNALSEREGLTPAYELLGAVDESTEWIRWNHSANGYRLPTEAEWEKAARNDQNLHFGATSTWDDVCTYSNLGSEESNFFSCFDRFNGLAPVRNHRFDSYLLYDTIGNVEEMVWDGWMQELVKGNDPEGLPLTVDRVAKGSSWRVLRQDSLVGRRRKITATGWEPDLGLRLARWESEPRNNTDEPPGR
ncbi:MAG: SUMF1/EgtB/PvdO family nonheme iron enzyme [Proteobacteria bacterium]|nr:SUMF1/EgtB/PvdO family nonheme iron enzyme [Pseudomonadota bacterium]